MLSEVYYLIRSKTDGIYLAAYPDLDDRQARSPQNGYILLFREQFDALSYLNKHASGVSDRFSVESIPGTQIDSVMKRWNFKGMGVVQDPLLPRVEFMSKG